MTGDCANELIACHLLTTQQTSFRTKWIVSCIQLSWLVMSTFAFVWSHANSGSQEDCSYYGHQSRCSLDHATWLFHVIPAQRSVLSCCLAQSRRLSWSDWMRFQCCSHEIIWVAAINLLGSNTPPQVHDNEDLCYCQSTNVEGPVCSSDPQIN